MKRSLVFFVAFVAACGLRAIPSPDGGSAGGAEAGGSAAGGSEAGGGEVAAGGGETAGGTSGTGGGGCSAPAHCVAPANATPVCNAGICGFVCAPSHLKCGAGCCRPRTLSAGDRHTCATTDEGILLCWGGAFTLGNGTTSASATPVMVQGFGDAGVAVVSAGSVHSCALTTGGAVKCWGAGPVGDGMSGFRSQATQAVGLEQGVTSLSLGGNHACVVADGGVKCWGFDSHGEQGCNQQCQAMGPQQLLPGPASGLAYDVKQVTCGSAHCCALLDDGGVRCWGFNIASECGDGTNVQRNVPVVAHAFDAGVDEVYGGWSVSCGREGTALRCIGTNGNGEQGVGTNQFARYARQVLLGEGLTQVAASGIAQHLCAVVDGGVWCWGLNDRGQLGDGQMMSQNRPVRVLGLNEPMMAAAVGGQHSCALALSGAVWCWGSNNYGQVGTGTIGGTLLQPQQVR
ncbi:MAG: hypothetical protein JNK82_10280 [Myxococcaceae bacterium]|nr:hypothetical protein [Myxococcaceae bacterium]